MSRSRRSGLLPAGIAVSALLAATLVPLPVAAAPAPPPSAPLDVQATELALGIQQVPKGSAAARQAVPPANPWLSLLPDPAQVDMATWRATAAAAGAAREQQRRQPADPLIVTEGEIGDAHTNDTLADAERIRPFGTGRRENPAALVSGSLAAPPPPGAVIEPGEDDGSIPLATDLGLAQNPSAAVSARIGDGPFGSTSPNPSGDFDFFRVDGQAGQVLVVDLDTPTDSELDSVVVLWTADGDLIAFNDDASIDSFDSLLIVTLPASGSFYVSVGAFESPVPEDPFDSSSGEGAGSEGEYSLSVTTNPDIDSFAVDLEKGDVLGASVSGAAPAVEVFDSRRRLAVGSTQDASFIYPADTPLPGGGNAVAAYVAERSGRHVVRVLGGIGDYELTLEAYRPGAETTGTTQTIFLDFDGARLNTNIFGGPGVRTLSPMSAFLGRWGLSAGDERALIAAIVRRVQENIAADPRVANGRLRVKILNSRDDRDPGVRPGVSRVIIGGTIAESGIPTIGIAQSIDPGNFAAAETALVLLDVLSEPVQPRFGNPSLNEYLTPASDRIAFVGQAVGNVTSHEIGHYVGSFHVDQFNEAANLMDQGGNFPLLYGVGPDGVGGTADDPDVDFGDDVYNPFEGFTGIEDTLNVTAFGLTRG